MKNISGTQAICRNIFKNSEKDTIKSQFTIKWLELINQIEKNKSIKTMETK